MMSLQDDRLEADTELPRSEREHSRAAGICIVIFLLLSVLLVYAPVLEHQFLKYDDDINITNNANLYPPSWDGLRQFWTSGYGGLYIPLTYTTWFGVTQLAATTDPTTRQFVLEPFVYHALNLVLHAGCVLLAYWLLVRLVENQYAAAAGALLFALHPLQVESVAWVSETKGLLSALLAIFAICCYREFVSRRDRGTLAWPMYFCALVVYVLAMLAKPVAASLPLLLIALDVGLWHRKPLRTFLTLVPWIVVALGFVIVTRIQQPADQIVNAPSLWSRVLIAGDSLTFYLAKLVWPVDLAPHYSRNVNSVLGNPWLVLWSIPPVIVVALIATLQHRRWWLTSAGVFVAALLPVLGLIPFAYQEFSNVADRYVYLAMLGPAMGVSFWFTCNPRAWKTLMVLAVAVVLGLASRQQCMVWRDTESLFLHTLQVNPASYRAENALGCVYQDRNNPTAAVPRFEAAVAINPDYAQGHYNLAMSYSALGNYSGAATHLKEVLQLQPESAPVRNYLGAMLFQLGETEAAVEQFEKAIDVDPDWTEAWNNLVLTLMQCGRNAEALRACDQAIDRDPLNVQARFQRAELLVRLEREEEATREFLLLLNYFTQHGDQSNAREVRTRLEALQSNTQAKD